MRSLPGHDDAGHIPFVKYFENKDDANRQQKPRPEPAERPIRHIFWRKWFAWRRLLRRLDFKAFSGRTATILEPYRNQCKSQYEQHEQQALPNRQQVKHSKMRHGSRCRRSEANRRDRPKVAHQIGNQPRRSDSAVTIVANVYRTMLRKNRPKERWTGQSNNQQNGRSVNISTRDPIARPRKIADVIGRGFFRTRKKNEMRANDHAMLYGLASAPSSISSGTTASNPPTSTAPCNPAHRIPSLYPAMMAMSPTPSESKSNSRRKPLRSR